MKLYVIKYKDEKLSPRSCIKVLLDNEGERIGVEAHFNFEEVKEKVEGLKEAYAYNDEDYDIVAFVPEKKEE